MRHQRFSLLMTGDFCYILSLSFYVPPHYAALAVPNTVITWNDLFVYARSRKKLGTQNSLLFKFFIDFGQSLFKCNLRLRWPAKANLAIFFYHLSLLDNRP